MKLSNVWDKLNYIVLFLNSNKREYFDIIVAILKDDDFITNTEFGETLRNKLVDVILDLFQTNYKFRALFSGYDENFKNQLLIELKDKSTYNVIKTSLLIDLKNSKFIKNKI